jgi:hypothetical protein
MTTYISLYALVARRTISTLPEAAGRIFMCFRILIVRVTTRTVTTRTVTTTVVITITVIADARRAFVFLHNVVIVNIIYSGPNSVILAGISVQQVMF